MNKLARLLEYQYKVQCEATEMIRQSNPLTAYGEGLEKISRALGLMGRLDTDLPCNCGQLACDGYRPETDTELRERIMKSLNDEV